MLISQVLDGLADFPKRHRAHPQQGLGQAGDKYLRRWVAGRVGAELPVLRVENAGVVLRVAGVRPVSCSPAYRLDPVPAGRERDCTRVGLLHPVRGRKRPCHPGAVRVGG